MEKIDSALWTRTTFLILILYAACGEKNDEQFIVVSLGVIILAIILNVIGNKINKI